MYPFLRENGSSRVISSVTAAVAVTVTVAALAGCSANTNGPPAASSTTATPDANVSAAQALEDAYATVVRNVLPSVVEIQTPTGLGSGVVFDPDGNIVTNAHVVGTSTTFRVTFANSATAVPATLVGAYPAGDLAVIRVRDAKGVKPATFGDSAALKVGDIVLAMGNPLGLTSSVTNGIVSATGRTVAEPRTPDSPAGVLTNAIQTSAPINPGNSGGALADLNSQVIGIPTLAATVPELGGAAPGIGFAISSNEAANIAKQLIADGKVTNSGRASLNVTVKTVAGPEGTPIGVGVISLQADGAAGTAGIKPGDIITAIDGSPTPTAEALQVAVATHKPGDVVRLSVLHPDGSTAEVPVTLR